MISLDIHLHGEGSADGDDDHALGEVHADEEGSLAHIHVEAGVHDLYLLAAEHLRPVKVSAKFCGNLNNIQIHSDIQSPKCFASIVAPSYNGFGILIF